MSLMFQPICWVHLPGLISAIAVWSFLPRCFSAVEHQKGPLGKPDMKSVVNQHSRFSIGKRNLQLAKDYLCVSVIQPLFSFYSSYTGCFYNLTVCSCGHGKTNKHTYKYTCIHTYIQTHTFRKTISGNQACAHSWPWLKWKHYRLTEYSLRNKK